MLNNLEDAPPASAEETLKLYEELQKNIQAQIAKIKNIKSESTVRRRMLEFTGDISTSTLVGMTLSGINDILTAILDNVSDLDTAIAYLKDTNKILLDVLNKPRLSRTSSREATKQEQLLSGGEISVNAAIPMAAVNQKSLELQQEDKLYESILNKLIAASKKRR